MKAYRVTIDDFCGISFATTAARAKWIVVRSYRSAFGTKEWPLTLTASRCPRYDGMEGDTNRVESEQFWISDPRETGVTPSEVL